MEKKMDPVLITVLMAEYNTNPHYLRESIASLLAQTETRFELLIVDDGTKNDLPGIVAEFADERIRVVGYGENRGFVAALNFGLLQARGEFIARMDTDDRSEPTYLEETLAFLQQNPEFAVVSGRAQETSQDGAALVLGTPGEITAKALMRGSVPIHPATMYRREAILGLGGYPTYKRSEDLALWCEVLLAGHRMHMLSSVLCLYRVDADDFSKRRLRNRRDEIRVRMHYYPKLGAGPREYLRIVKSIVSGMLPVPLVRWVRSRIHVKA